METRRGGGQGPDEFGPDWMRVLAALAFIDFVKAAEVKGNRPGGKHVYDVFEPATMDHYSLGRATFQRGTRTFIESFQVARWNPDGISRVDRLAKAVFDALLCYVAPNPPVWERTGKYIIRIAAFEYERMEHEKTRLQRVLQQLDKQAIKMQSGLSGEQFTLNRKRAAVQFQQNKHLPAKYSAEGSNFDLVSFTDEEGLEL